MLLNDKADREAREAAAKKAEQEKLAALEAAKAKAEEIAKAAEAAAAAATTEAEKKAADEQAKLKAEAQEAANKAKTEADEAAAKFKEEKEAAVAAAAAAASPPAPEEKKKPIKFKDAVGRKFSFPFHLCRTWEVRKSFLLYICSLHVLMLINSFGNLGHGGFNPPSISACRYYRAACRRGPLRSNWAE